MLAAAGFSLSFSNQPTAESRQLKAEPKANLAASSVVW
jgi:hypothetical protein